LRKRHGDYVATATIGVGGENLVRFACIDIDSRQAGRAGLGAVLGAKKLKALVVSGTAELPAKEPERLLALAQEILETMKKSPIYRDDTKYGTGEFLEWINEERGTFPTKNWLFSVYEHAKDISPYAWVEKYVKKNIACFSCVKPCGKYFKVERGRYAGVELDGPEYETLFSLGANCYNNDIETLAKAHALCDIYGIDAISAGAVIALAKELYERKILKTSLDLSWDNTDNIPQLIELIATRRELGDELAEGVARFAKRYRAERFAVHVKNMAPPAYDVRGIKGLALAFATSPRGACHLRSCAYALELVGTFWKFKDVDRLSAKDKGAKIKAMEDLMTLYDCLGACKFSRSVFLAEGFSEVIRAVTGRELTETQLLEVGARVNTVKRLFNVRCGVTREWFRLPERLTREPIKGGVSEGALVREAELTGMLDEYFAARGWDAAGVPREDTLRALGIDL
jgi:aldehyde:ferredoxin oxidoreductase